MADVFVSYARTNRDRVAAISGGLERAGYSLWWDSQLASGADYGQVIEREIEAAACVVVAWSNSARQSLWVRAEANEALDAGKLVQLSLDRAKLPLPFTMLHSLDFSGWKGDSAAPPWPELEARVRATVAGEPEAGKTEAAEPDLGYHPPGPTLQGFERTAILGWASIALAALIAVAIILAVRGIVPPALFGGLTLLALAAATGLLALSAWTLLRVAAASRR